MNQAYDRIAAHVGHEVAVVSYGEGLNVAVECIDCGEILFDEHHYREDA